MIEANPIKFRIEHCDEPLADKILLREASGLLWDNQAVRAHLAICVSCGLRFRKAQKWVAEKIKANCTHAQSLFRAHFDRKLSQEQTRWMEVHLVYCADCWELFGNRVDVWLEEQASLSLISTLRAGGEWILGALTNFPSLRLPLEPVFAGQSAGLIETESLPNWQSFEAEGIKAVVTAGLRGDLLVSVQPVERIDPIMVHLYIETESGRELMRSVQTDAEGNATLGLISQLPRGNRYHLAIQGRPTTP